MRMVLPRSLGVIGIKSIKKWHGEKMAEFGKNTKGIVFTFCRKLPFFEIVIFWCIINIWPIRIKEMQTAS